LQEAPQPGMSQYTQQYAPAHAPQQNTEAPGMTAPGTPAQNGASQGGGAQSDEPPF
ncbi:MAG: single-stranded DNA-binding protein, partial [Rothia mucilaginosa]